VQITELDTMEGKQVFTHRYTLKDTVFLIEYAPLIGVIGIAKNGVHYSLRMINNHPFDLAKAVPLMSIRRWRYLN
jgi:hypothetical protein